jgi:hypothetical protein
MEYSELKKKIANETRSLQNLQGHLAKRINLQQYIESEVGNFSLPKSEPDIVERDWQVIKRTANGGWDDNDKYATVKLKLKKVAQSNKYKTYKIIKIIDDGGLKNFLQKQVPSIKSEIIKVENRILKYKSELETSENHNLKRFEKYLLLLEEAKASSISNKNKKEIDWAIDGIKEGKDFMGNDANEIVRYKLPKLWYMGAKQYVSGIIRRLGGSRYHKSGKDVSGSVYYKLPNGDSIRLSDHELPETETRKHNRSIGIGGDWIEFVLDNPKPFSELKTEILERLLEDIGTNGTANEEDTAKIKNKIKNMLAEIY